MTNKNATKPRLNVNLTPVLSVIALSVLLCVSSVKAQTEEGESTNYDTLQIERIKNLDLNTQLSASFTVTNHQDTLRRAFQTLDASNVGFGFSFYGAYSFAPHPLVLGADIGFNFYGEDTKSVTQSGSGIRTDYDMRDFQIPVLVFARLQPSASNWVFPFVEGLGGLTTFISGVSPSERQYNDNHSHLNETKASVAWNYGVGVGFGIKVADIITLPNSLQRTFIETRLRYLRNTSVELPNVTFDESNNIVVSYLDVPASSTLSFNIGISFQF